jgi:hypothetical protein
MKWKYVLKARGRSQTKEGSLWGSWNPSGKAPYLVTPLLGVKSVLFAT